MALGKKYAGLPDLDVAQEIYETPALTDDASTIQTDALRTASPTSSDEGGDERLVRENIDREAAWRRFEPTRVSSRDVNFSDTIAAGARKSYRTKGRRRRRRDYDEGSGSDSEEETVSSRIARLKREAEEVRLELAKKDEGEFKDSVEQQQAAESEEDGLEELTKLLQGLDGSKTNGTVGRSEEQFLKTLTTTSKPPEQNGTSGPEPPAPTSKGTGAAIANHPPSPIRPFFRTATETTLLKILLELLRRAVTATMPPEGSIETFLKAGLVKRWLANYPFPCALPMYSKLNYKRADVTSLLDNVQNRFDDPLMVDIFMLLTTSTAAERELQAVGLAHRSSRLRERFVHGDGDGFDVSRYSDAGWQTILPTRSDRNGIDLPRRRSSEERTVEDERVRRRHREAMVMADPDRPVSGRDILQRIDSGGPVRRGESLDIFEGILPLRPPRREHGSFQLFEDDGEEQEEMASMMSFSEVEDGASTAESMPSLRSVDEERQAEYERARREELETRLGARMVAAEESGVGGTRSTAALDIIGNTLERALQAREQSRAASGMEGASGNGGRSAP